MGQYVLPVLTYNLQQCVHSILSDTADYHLHIGLTYMIRMCMGQSYLSDTTNKYDGNVQSNAGQPLYNLL